MLDRQRTLADSVTLVVPGLLGPFPAGHGPFHAPSLKALETWLSRGQWTDVQARGFESLLLEFFGVEVDADAELPVAPLCRLGDGASVSAGFCLRADPVHLCAEQDRVYLLESERLTLTCDEARDFAAEINAVYGPEGWRLEVLDPHCWYLHVPDADAPQSNRPRRLRTTPTFEVLGEDIHPFLPGGEEGSRWRAVYNELQMLLHLSPVNARREASGEPVVNGLWLWGGGVLPKQASCSGKAVFSNEPLARGLGKLAGAEVKPLPATGRDWLETGAGDSLLVFDVLRDPLGRGDAETFRHRLVQFNRDWLEPLDEALRGGHLDTVAVHFANGRGIMLNRRMRRRWWRRRLSLFAHLEARSSAR